MRMKPKDYRQTVQVVECRESVWRSSNRGEVDCYIAVFDLPYDSGTCRADVIQGTIERLGGLFRPLEPKGIKEIDYDIINPDFNAFGAVYNNRCAQDKWQLTLHLKNDLDMAAFKSAIKEK